MSGPKHTPTPARDVVTRDEVARECEKLGWKLEEWIGPEVVNAPGPYYAVTDGPLILASANDAKTAYLAALARVKGGER